MAPNALTSIQSRLRKQFRKTRQVQEPRAEDISTDEPVLQHEPKLYSPLHPNKSEIRILEFVEPSHDRDVEFNLRTRIISLDDADHVPFNTLSYIWGPAVFDHLVHLDGFPVHITSTLYHAFVDIAKFEESFEFWWADALCIDQSNFAERASQVRLMSRIYSSSHWTVAHLGEFEPLAGALKLLIHLAKQRGQPDAEARIIEDAGNIDWSDNWKGVFALLSHPYFKRVWILQESIVSKKLLILNSDGPWLEGYMFILALSYLKKNFQNTHKLLMAGPKVFFGHNLDEVMYQLSMRFNFHKIRSDLEPLSFMDVFIKALQLKATDPRDHLYGVLSMCEDGLSLVRTQDYQKSVQEVFAEFVENYYHLHGSFEVILLSRFPHRMTTLPSWVPDLTSWEQPNRPGGMVVEEIKRKSLNKTNFLAYGKGVNSVEFCESSILLARGVRLGRIVVLSGQYKDRKDDDRTHFEEEPEQQKFDSEWLQAQISILQERPSILDAIANCLTFSSLETIGDEVPPTLLGLTLELSTMQSLRGTLDLTTIYTGGNEAFWKQCKDLTFAGKTISAWFEASGRTEEEITAQLQQAHDSAQMKTHGEMKYKIEDDVNWFCSRMSYVMMELERRLCIIDHRLIGTVPESTRLQDECWVIYGCSIPVVLRPRSAGGYEIVGEAYVHGAMHGEATVGDQVDVRDIAIY